MLPARRDAPLFVCAPREKTKNFWREISFRAKFRARSANAFAVATVIGRGSFNS